MKRPDDEPRSTPSEIRERKFRALAEALDVRWVEREPYPAVEVRNPVRRTGYLTLWPAFPERTPALCTCTDFARRGLGDCKHLEAAWRWLARSPPPHERRHPEDRAGVARVWEEIDRRLGALPPVAERDIRRASEPGEALYERGDRHRETTKGQ